MGNQPVNGWLLPAFLIAACLVPLGFGPFRMFEIVVAGQFALEFAQGHVDRVPLFLHMLGSLFFLGLGALQILPGLRYRHLSWHRRVGRLVAPMGLLGAASGFWMTLLHPDISGALLYWGRLGASVFWMLAIILALVAVRRRDFRTHGAWMIRAYAIALPAGTLAFILLPFVLIFGEEGHGILLDLIQVLAWPAHLAIGEWLIRRDPKRTHSPQPSISSISRKGT